MILEVDDIYTAYGLSQILFGVSLAVEKQATRDNRESDDFLIQSVHRSFLELVQDALRQMI